VRVADKGQIQTRVLNVDNFVRMCTHPHTPARMLTPHRVRTRMHTDRLH